MARLPACNRAGVGLVVLLVTCMSGCWLSSRLYTSSTPTLFLPPLEERRGTLRGSVFDRNESTSTTFAPLLLDFVKLPRMDFNAGAHFDVLRVHRVQRRQSAVNTTSSSSRVTFGESILDFLERCSRACLNKSAAECSGYVVQDDAVCFLKRMLPLSKMPCSSCDSYLRRESFSKTSSDEYPRRSTPLVFRKRVGFGVLAAAKYATDRLVPALNTWLCDVDALMLFEDDPESHAAVDAVLRGLTRWGRATGVASEIASSSMLSFWGRTTSDEILKAKSQSAPSGGSSGALNHASRAPDEPMRCSPPNRFALQSVRSECQSRKYVSFASIPNNAHVRSFNGAWKNFPLLVLMSRVFPLKDWVVMVDDDTFVVQENLNLLIHSVYDILFPPLIRAVMVGAIFRVGGGSRNDLFVQGGAGILMSRAAMNLLAAAADSVAHQNESTSLLATNRTGTPVEKLSRRERPMPNCYEYCQQWAGDIRMGCCARLVGIVMKHDFTFWSEDVVVSLTSARRAELAMFPTTFHQMKQKELVCATHEAVASSYAAAAAQGQPVRWEEIRNRLTTVGNMSLHRDDE